MKAIRFIHGVELTIVFALSIRCKVVAAFLTGKSLSRHALLRASMDAFHGKDYSNEETLLRLSLLISSSCGSADEAKKRVSKYAQSFPFSAVLPVQPLMYLPTADDGVEIRFLRKKTDDKSGVDGGIRFFIKLCEDDDDDDSKCIDVTAKRNSEGQSIAKIFAERLVVTAFVSGLKGEETSKYGSPPTDVFSIKSVYHKWLDEITKN